MGTVVIGQGTWGKRIASALLEVKTWTHGENGFAIPEAEIIYVAVPAPYLRETLELFLADPQIPVVSCAKGLDPSGLLPSEVIRELWGSADISHLGGACLSSELIVCPRHGGLELETASVLKNVYAIGFNYIKTTEGLNVACMALTDYWQEMPQNREGYADLLATCFSDRSRNARVGRMLAENKPLALRGQVAEGLSTACVIEKQDLFREKWELRNLTKLIVRRLA